MINKPCAKDRYRQAWHPDQNHQHAYKYKPLVPIYKMLAHLARPPETVRRQAHWPGQREELILLKKVEK